MSKIALTAQEVLRRGFLAFKQGRLTWLEGAIAENSEGEKIDDLYALVKDDPKAIKNVTAVCSIGAIDYVIAQQPGLTKKQRDTLREEAALLLQNSILDWANHTPATQIAYKEYVENIRQLAEEAQEALESQLRRTIRAEVEALRVDTLVTPLSFELWITSDLGREALVDEGTLPDETVWGDPVSGVIEFNDGGYTVDADTIQDVFKRAAYKGKKR